MRAFQSGLAIALSVYALSASTIVAVDGPINSGVLLSTTQVLGASWSQSGTYTDVAISAVLDGPTPVTAYLTTQAGPGTTTAQEVSRATVALSGGSFSSVLLMSLPSLGPGTYYLTLFTDGKDLTTDSWAQTLTGTTTLAPGSNLNDYYNSITASGYPPANNFNFVTFQPLLFEVTGTAVPEPGTCGLVGFAVLAGLVLIKREV